MDITITGESHDYREKRNALLAAELELRARIEEVAALRRALPLGAEVEDYTFEGENGPVNMRDLFGAHDTLILYSFMYGENATKPCPMCSAFVDSLSGQMQHLQQCLSLYLVSRRIASELSAVKQTMGWDDVPWLSAQHNRYPIDFKSEMADGSQVPMLNVFVRRDDKVYHHWMSEMFFAPSPWHPRHVDMVWPLWHLLDLTPEGRGDYMPSLQGV